MLKSIPGLSLGMVLSEIAVFHGGGGGLVNGFLMLLLVGVCLLLIWLSGRWVIGKCGAPPIVLTCWSGLFGLIGLIVIINFLMGLAGKGFITY